MELTSENTVIGFIGIGVMGKSMAANLIRAGYELHIYGRTRSKAEDLIDMGAEWHDDKTAMIKEVNVVITIVGFPQDVRDIYLGEEGIIHHARPNTLFIDMTTSSPSLAKEIYLEAKQKQLCSLDAPVSGGDVGAREARLSIMVGGDADDFEAARPIFQAMGTNIVHQGKAGAGQHTKMCNQIAIASNMIGVCEALSYAIRSGLDPNVVLKSIETGAAGSWSLSNLGPRIINDNFEPGFYVKHFIKDMVIALQSAKEMGMDAPGLSLAKSLYEQLAELGEGNSGTQALFKIINS
jgi:3-hydroxyisobutyrate dehydrogenase